MLLEGLRMSHKALEALGELEVVASGGEAAVCSPEPGWQIMSFTGVWDKRGIICHVP